MAEQTQQRCVTLFLNAIGSKVTQKNYLYELDRFVKWNKIETGNYDDLLKADDKAISNEPKLFWCNGIMFIAYGYADDKVASKTIETHIQYTSEVEYAECPEFIEQAKWNGYSVEVQNKTNHSEYEALTQAIKEGNI